MSELELDPSLLETLRTLQQHDVEFVLVGDVAEAIYNNGGFVSGVAIVPGAYGRNVERLNAALQAMDAELGIAGTPAATPGRLPPLRPARARALLVHDALRRRRPELRAARHAAATATSSTRPSTSSWRRRSARSSPIGRDLERIGRGSAPAGALRAAARGAAARARRRRVLARRTTSARAARAARSL